MTSTDRTGSVFQYSKASGPKENREEKLKEQAASLSQVTEKTQQLDAEHQEIERQKQARLDAAEKLRQALSGFASGSDITFIRRKDVPTLRIANTSLFVNGEMSLKPEAQDLLKKVATAVMPQLKDHAIRLENFTDNDPISGTMKAKYPSNYELSAARAAVVARFLASEGKIPADHIIVVGRGEQNPIGSNDTKDGRAKNRRTEILLEPLDLSVNGTAQ